MTVLMNFILPARLKACPFKTALLPGLSPKIHRESVSFTPCA